MGRGVRKEYSRGPMIAECRESAGPWPDCFDLNYTLDSRDPVKTHNAVQHPSRSSPMLSTRQDLAMDFPGKGTDGFLKTAKGALRDCRDSGAPAPAPWPNCFDLNYTLQSGESGKNAHNPVSHHSFSSPISTAPGNSASEFLSKQSSPFDFDDFLATLKPEEPDSSPQANTGNTSRFKQFFDDSHGTPPPRGLRHVHPSADHHSKDEQQAIIPPYQSCQANAAAPGHPTHLSTQHRMYELQQHQQLPRRGRKVSSRRQAPSKPLSQQPSNGSPEVRHPSPCNPFDCHNIDDITEADMAAATARFLTIRKASVASSLNETNTTRPTEESPVEATPPPVDRERPRYKAQQQSSNPSRWSPSTAASANAANATSAGPSAPPSNMATAALLQARLLAQQRAASSGIFPGGQVTQLVRPPMPVYQAGVQGGLPLQSAALLSQFVWLNVL
ncbi:uncharacterized protein LOC135804838 [Sycon ciliatum]|uniref:uncharacterized protein LOC135804838 n=1 Tax=Sycon ciliatum TaxID=27933 RepID=UPI0031F65BE8|eukprot:scpid52657/ scgid5330/ 